MDVVQHEQLKLDGVEMEDQIQIQINAKKYEEMEKDLIVYLNKYLFKIIYIS